MFQPVKIAALAAAMFLAVVLPARAADAVTADDTARFLAGMPPSADSPLTPLTKDPSWQRHAKFFDNAFGQLEQRQLSKIRAWAERQSGRAAADHVLHVQRSGLPLRGRVLFQGDDLCAERARAGRLGARSDAIAAWRRRRRASQRRALAELDPELQLLHHQADEDRSAVPASSAAPCRSSMCSWRARARPSATSVRSRSTTRGRRISPTKIRARTPRGASASCSRAAMARKRRCIISRPTFPTAASGSAAS